MALPERVRVKLSSESAGYVAMTPVVVQEFTLLELLEHVLSATGKDAARAAEILRRGSLVSGASRLRWEALHASEAEVWELMAALPGPDPSLPYRPQDCERAVLAGPSMRLEITRETACQKRLLQRRSFWDALLAEVAAPVYVTYQYRNRYDHYRASLSVEARERLREAAGLLRFEELARQVQAGRFDCLDLYVRR